MGQVHRLSNHTKEPLIVIEVQTGEYLGEDDIVRYEDVYERVKSAQSNPSPNPNSTHNNSVWRSVFCPIAKLIGCLNVI